MFGTGETTVESFSYDDEQGGNGTPFYRDEKYIGLIEQQYLRFIDQKIRVERFLGDGVHWDTMKDEMSCFCIDTGCDIDDVIFETKGSPLFDEDEGPGIVMAFERLPTEEEINEFVKDAIMSKVARMNNLEKALEKFSDEERNLLQKLTYIT